MQERWERYNIYAYDLSDGREIPVAVAPGHQRQPAIHGDIVVWSDNRNSPQIGTRAEGCHNLPDRRCDIYSYNLATGEEKLLAQTGNNNGSPSIHGNLVAWQQYLEAGGSIIVLLDLSTGEHRDIGAGGRSETRPLVSGNHVVWSVREACDVGGFPSFFRNKSATGPSPTGWTPVRSASCPTTWRREPCCMTTWRSLPRVAKCHPDVTLCSSTDHLDDSTDKAPSASATSAGSHDRPAQVLLNLSTRRERFGTV